MIRSAVTVSLVEGIKGPFVLWHDLPAACRLAKGLSFDAVEIFPPSPEAIDIATVKSMTYDLGLAVAAVGTGAGWVKQGLHLTQPEAQARTKARAFIKSVIDVAGPLGAPAIIGSMQGRTSETVDLPTALGYLSEALEDLGDHARQYHVPLLFEPLNRYETNLINTIEAGVNLLRPLSTRNVKLLADLFHMNIEEADIAAALRAGGDFIGHVHFVDSNRRPAGLGHMDYAPIAHALGDINYSGFASAEAFPYPDPEAAARQTIETFRRVFRR